MTAPFARTAIVPVHGIAPFVVEQPGVIADPNDHFVRSLWTFDVEADSFSEINASMRRVGTILSGIEQGDQPGSIVPPEQAFFGIGSDNPRRSRLSTRFAMIENYFEDTVPSSGEDDYDETIFIAIFAPVVGVIEPSDWVLFGVPPNDGVGLPLPQVLDLNYQARVVGSNLDVSEQLPGGFLIDVPGGGAPGSIPTAIPNTVVPGVFIGDGSDGNPPVFLADGRTPAQQRAYIESVPGNLYLGFPFGKTGTVESELALITASIAHSIGMVNG